MVDFDFGGHTFVNLVISGRVGHYFSTDEHGSYGGVTLQKFSWFADKFNFKIRWGN